MQQNFHASRRLWRRRAMSLLLALVMILGLVPGLPSLESAASAHWADPYLSQLVEWGFIRSDQAGYPDRALTRADFMAITNRAYGYHETGETPFKDVAENDWFYDDVGIAYTAKYIKGTSPTTASPRSPLTRETAATILGRNMMLEESPGELLDFTDARQISNWARGTVKSSLEHYLVSGYDDGTFRPQRNVSWGEMAAMLTNLIGTPLQEPGDYSLGGVFGNVTITSPDVTLRDTVISGDLYISGGVGLGGIKLENVTVLGRIIASGTGQSEGGEASILLRNVTADELLVDNLRGNLVTLQADGITDVGRTTVRTSAYIEDNTPDGMGLKYISLEGETYPEGEEPDDWEPILLQLAGRIEEVVNRTPQSTVQVGRGTVAKLTVDEAATDSNVIIDRGAVVKELNLDTATIVTGQGDIEHLVVNAPGCEVEMLPDKIDIRPGVTAIIAGEEMDTVGAEESSEEPRILAGYPQAQDIIPTGLDAVFSTNKAGTVYWAVSALSDGSVGEEALIKPPSYGNIAVKNGSIKVAKGNEETTAKVNGLTPGGSYYLSAVLVDARGKRSAVKVISFTTPDNTTPAFCNGYPKMSKVSRTDSVVVVMPNKDCKLYYALLPQGATAPTENELKTGAVSGALGYGVRDVTKNVEDAFRVNDVILDETTTYVLYLWLTDADGVNKGKIQSLSFTTDDDTPPEFISGPTQVKTQATSVGLEFQLSENGTVYWVAVPAGTVYPKPEPGTSYETAPLNSDYAKLQVVSGMNIGADGKYGKVSAREGVKGTINISGLKPESVYDLYYVAKDNAGADRNYSVTVKKMTINTLDNKAPVFTQSFSNTSDGSNPRVDTDIYLDVTEDVLYLGQNGGVSLLELYRQTQTGTADAREQAVNRLAENLYKSIVLHKYDVQTRREENIHLKYQRNDPATDYAIDYTQAKVEARREGGIRITFPSSSLQLENGGQYCFIINDLGDTSNARNPIEPGTGVDFWNYEKQSKAAGHNVPVFVVDLPVVNLNEPVIGSEGPVNADGSHVRIDMSFYMEPVSTSTMSDNIDYDVLLWSRSTMSYDLYYRIVDHSGNVIDYTANQDIMLANTSTKAADADANGWMYLGNSGLCNPAPLDPKKPDGQKAWSGRSLSAFFNKCDDSQYAQLNNLSEDHHYQFVISLTQLNNWGPDYRTWDDTAYMEINVAAGQAQNLAPLAGSSGTPTHETWEKTSALGIIRGVQSIGNWQDNNNQFSDTQLLEREFTISTVPSFTNNTPEFIFNAGGSVSINLNLTSNGTVHYAIAEVDSRTNRSSLTTIRELMEGTDDYVPGPDGTPIPNTEKGNVQMTGSGDGMYITTNGPRPPAKSGNLREDPMPDWMIGGYPDNTTDDPEGENRIIEPSNLLIVQNKWQSQVTDSGTFTPQEGVNDAVTTDKVKPNTTYFAYFVITGEDSYDNMSHVYIYQFTTPEAMKPAIKLDSDSSGDVDMEIDVATRGYYRVMSWSDANNAEMVTILSKPFALFTEYNSNVEPDSSEDGYGFTIKESGFEKGTPETYLMKADGTPYTVLDSLLDGYNYSFASPSYDRGGDLTKDPSYPKYYYPERGGDAYAYATGYTVFDMYASNTARAQIYNLIQSGRLSGAEQCNINNDGWGPFGATNTKAPNRGEEWALTHLETGKDLKDSEYLFLTYAINPQMVQSGSPSSSQNTDMIASFSGMKFQKGAMRPPEVEDETGADGRIERDGLGFYKGTITIRFDRDVYLHGGRGSERITKDNLLVGAKYPLNPPLTPPEDGRFGTGTLAVDYISGTRGFNLSFSGVRTGGSYSFPSGYFANTNNEEANKELKFEVRNVDGVPSLVVTWAGAKGSPWVFPLEDDSNDYNILLHSNPTSALLKGSELVLDLNTTGTNSTVQAKLTAEVYPELKSVFKTSWGIKGGSAGDVVEIDPPENGSSDKSETTVKGRTPGKTIITLTISGEKEDGAIVSLDKEIPVTVLGAVDMPTTLTSSSGNTTLSSGVLTMITGKGLSPSATFTIKADGGKDLSSSTLIDCKSSASKVVDCTVNPNGTVTIKPAKTGAIDDSAIVTIGLKAADGTDLTPETTDKVTLVVTLKPESTTPTPAPAPTPGASLFSTDTVKPAATTSKPVVPKGLKFTNVSGAKLSGSSLKLTGTSMSSIIKAEITPDGATGAIKWTSSNPSVATVTGSGSQVTIRGLTAGTATITASVSGTSVTKTITVTVEPSISVSSFAANSASSTITKGSDGSYTWTRKSGTSCAATLKFSTGMSLDNVTVTVTSSDKNAVSVGKVTKSGSSGQVQLTFGSMNKSGAVTVTIKAGSASQSFKINLAGGDVGANLLSKKS